MAKQKKKKGLSSLMGEFNNIKNDSKSKPEVQLEVQPEVKPEVKSEVKSEVKPKVKLEVPKKIKENNNLSKKIIPKKVSKPKPKIELEVQNDGGDNSVKNMRIRASTHRKLTALKYNNSQLHSLTFSKILEVLIDNYDGVET